MNLAKIQASLRDVAKLSLRWGAIASGQKPLSKGESYSLLAQHQVWHQDVPSFTLPALSSLNGMPFHPEAQVISFDEDAVWKVQASSPAIRKIIISRAGTPIVNHIQILDLDFGNTAGLFNPPFPNRSIPGPVIAPWAHFWGGYYDYTLFVAAKLLRIKSQVSASVWNAAVVAYPLQGSAFEKQWLELLGVPEQSRVDTRETGNISAPDIYLGNNQQWFFPSPGDVLRMRETFSHTPEIIPGKRLFLSRKHTRVLLNESEIAPRLEELGFQIIEDKSRTLSEQMELFAGAEVILGVHGAAFTNIMWAPPGAHIIELFAGAYFPPYFYYLAHVLGQKYDCLLEDPLRENHHSAKFDNMCFDPEQLISWIKDAI